MKRVLLIMAIVVVAALVSLSMTKPAITAHYDTVKGVVVKVLDKKFGNTLPDESLRTMGMMTALNTVDVYMTKNLRVFEHTFYNTGMLLYNGNFVIVTVGLWGHVFLLFPEEELGKVLDRVGFDSLMDAVKEIE